MLQLDQLGVAISTGSACMAGAVEASKVLTAMSLSDDRISSALRITLGRQTTEHDIDSFVTSLKSII